MNVTFTLPVIGLLWCKEHTHTHTHTHTHNSR